VCWALSYSSGIDQGSYCGFGSVMMMIFL